MSSLSMEVFPKNKSKDPYRQKADDKRVNALIQMNKSNQQQKSLVKAALSNLESTKSKKIVFNDDDESVETVQNGSIGSEIEPNNKTGHTLDKLTLFNDDDDENDKEAAEINFGLKQQFQGKKGKELFELQTRFNNDKRFQLDERFANADDDAVSENEKEEGDIQHESRKQMEILSEVLGKKFELKGDKPRKVMRRFDPTNLEHSKYLIAEKNDEPVKKKSKKEKAKEAAAKQAELPVVSRDTFYEVMDKLKEALTEKSSFSLLNMFGKRSEDEEPNADHDRDNHKTLSKKAPGSNPFKYDSSDDEGDDSKKQDKTGQDTTQPKANERTIANNNFNQGRLWIEPFFFQVDDYRLQEGLDFVQRLIGQDDNENFQDVRHRLKKITKKKAHNVEVKQNKLIKKHSKNLKKKKKAK